jgi:diamine N-acetyltransferase
MVIAVRGATVNDAALISRLATETFYETYSWYNTPENMKEYIQTHFNPEKTKYELSEKETYFFLVSVNDEVAGYAKMRNVEHPKELKGKRYLEIERIYVIKKLQEHKLGYALMQHCFEKGRNLKLDCIWLGVWEKNTRAIAFYEKIGFKKFGTHNFQLGDDAQNDLLLRYDLH